MANILGFFKNWKEEKGTFWLEGKMPILEAGRIFKNFGARLITITAFLASDFEINLYYHFEVGLSADLSADKAGEAGKAGNKIYTLKYKTTPNQNKVQGKNPRLRRIKLKKIESISVIFPSADWIEKEISESYGVEFEGHENMTNLLLTSQIKTPLLEIEKEKFSAKGGSASGRKNRSNKLIN